MGVVKILYFQFLKNQGSKKEIVIDHPFYKLCLGRAV